jgi:prophage maintenance system killer protein
VSNTPDDASRGELVLYAAPDGAVRVEVQLHGDTVWLTQAQMAELFGRERSVVTKHVQNVFREGELEQDGNVQILHIAGSDKPVGFYSLDVIISVGYRVKSHRGTQFRIWATRVLRDHLVQGYSVNQARLRDLGQAVRLIAETAQRRDLAADEAQALLAIIGDYNRALDLLDDYDHQRVSKPGRRTAAPYALHYEEALRIVEGLRRRFGESALFGVEKDQGLASALGAIRQTFGGEDLYPGLEEKAAHLLYFLVKNHAFVDGNKRIAAALFLWFLERNDALSKADGTPSVSNETLVALTLMIAESRPEEKDILVRILMHLLVGEDWP